MTWTDRLAFAGFACLAAVAAYWVVSVVVVS
jgi:hypothetical protein